MQCTDFGGSSSTKLQKNRFVWHFYVLIPKMVVSNHALFSNNLPLFFNNPALLRNNHCQHTWLWNFCRKAFQRILEREGKSFRRVFNVPYLVFHCSIDRIDTSIVNGIKAKVGESQSHIRFVTDLTCAYNSDLSA